MKQIQQWRENILAKHLAKPENQNFPESELIHINDWFESSAVRKYLTRLHRYSVPMILEISKKWSETLAQYHSLMETTTDTIEILNCSGGYRWVKLLSANSYTREGTIMGHCVGNYKNKKNSEIYSLRDKKNLPHCTLEISVNLRTFDFFIFDKSQSITGTKKFITQTSGKANSAVKLKYHPYLKEFILFIHKQKNDFEANLSLYSRYNWIYLNGDLLALSEIKEFTGNFDLSDQNCSLSDSLTVKGNCDLSSFRGKLPQYLEVEGNLNLSNFRGIMPERLIVKGNLKINNLRAIQRSEELRVSGTLAVHQDCLPLPQSWCYGNLDIQERDVSAWRWSIGSIRHLDSTVWEAEATQCRYRANRPRQKPLMVCIDDYHGMVDLKKNRHLFPVPCPETRSHSPFLRVKKEIEKNKLEKFNITDYLDKETYIRSKMIDQWLSNKTISSGKIFANCAEQLVPMKNLIKNKDPDKNSLNLRPYQKIALSKFKR